MSNDIKNWSMFKVNRVAISLIKNETDQYTLYKPFVVYFLDDGKEYENLEDMKNISMILDMVMECPKCLSLSILQMMDTMFPNSEIDSRVRIWDRDMELVEDYDFNEDFEDHQSEDENGVDEQQYIPEKRTLH